MNKRDKMYAEIKKHGENINTIFNTGIDPILLCKRLRRYEHIGTQANTDYCNGIIDISEWEKRIEKLVLQVNKILKNTKKIPVIINGDPRGYCLKIDDKYIREKKIKIYTDMGGYGILAPDFSE